MANSRFLAGANSVTRVSSENSRKLKKNIAQLGEENTKLLEEIGLDKDKKALANEED